MKKIKPKKNKVIFEKEYLTKDDTSRDNRTPTGEN